MQDESKVAAHCAVEMYGVSWTRWQTHTLEPKPSFPRISYCWWPRRGDQYFGNQSFTSLVEARAKGFSNGR